MSQVTITIGPKPYTIVCGDGEEAKIAALGEVIDGYYAKLGSSRAVQETQNLVFAALFMADDLEEIRKSADAARRAVEHTEAKNGGRDSEMRTEIETLRKAEERAREDANALRAELAKMREAARHQHDLFGDEKQAEAIAAKLEALASRAEETASALEGAA
ncbi:cell division protein ZapA [Erythrobacter sp. JK5]|uniref:cell division protein ZapA n=1 Tax=Erythrobacter sp. JK5 TaxID=2829500 RepID=UPI001BA4A168|nr:cell division protein ZapA [Erythrobacter sp. JK5]QUL38880.1 cell division protein ZapA [Erythrobacter sp. JK5]